MKGSGTQFDPALLPTFLELAGNGVLDEVTERVNLRLADSYDLGLLEEPGLWLSRQS